MSKSTRKSRFQNLSIIIFAILMIISVNYIIQFNRILVRSESLPYELGESAIIHTDNTPDVIHYQLQNNYDAGTYSFLLWIETEKAFIVDILRDEYVVDQNVSVSSKGIRFILEYPSEFKVYNALNYSYMSYLIDTEQSPASDYYPEYIELYSTLDPLLEFSIEYTLGYDSIEWGFTIVGLIIYCVISLVFISTSYSSANSTKRRRANQDQHLVNMKLAGAPHEEIDGFNSNIRQRWLYPPITLDSITIPFGLVTAGIIFRVVSLNDSLDRFSLPVGLFVLLLYFLALWQFTKLLSFSESLEVLPIFLFYIFTFYIYLLIDNTPSEYPYRLTQQELLLASSVVTIIVGTVLFYISRYRYRDLLPKFDAKPKIFNKEVSWDIMFNLGYISSMVCFVTFIFVIIF